MPARREGPRAHAGLPVAPVVPRRGFCTAPARRAGVATSGLCATTGPGRAPCWAAGVRAHASGPCSAPGCAHAGVRPCRGRGVGPSRASSARPGPRAAPLGRRAVPEDRVGGLGGAPGCASGFARAQWGPRTLAPVVRARPIGGHLRRSDLGAVVAGAPARSRGLSAMAAVSRACWLQVSGAAVGPSRATCSSSGSAGNLHAHGLQGLAAAVAGFKAASTGGDPICPPLGRVEVDLLPFRVAGPICSSSGRRRLVCSW